MTYYKELQKKVKAYREAGHETIKLNSTKVALEAELARLESLGEEAKEVQKKKEVKAPITYKELQKKVKAYREAGHKTIKLNSTKADLEAELARLESLKETEEVQEVQKEEEIKNSMAQAKELMTDVEAQIEILKKEEAIDPTDRAKELMADIDAQIEILKKISLALG